MRSNEFSNIAATWIGLAVATAGGYATFHQYRDSVSKQVDDRATAALNFVMHFQSQHMLPLRDKVYNAIFCGDDCASKRVTNSELFAFIEFFDVVNLCVDKGQCDAEIVRDVFGSYATWHWPCLSSFVEATRRSEAEFKLAKPFGHGLQSLAIRDTGKEHCGNLRSTR